MSQNLLSAAVVIGTLRVKSNTPICRMVNKLLGPKNQMYKSSMLYLPYFLQKLNIKDNQFAEMTD